VVDHEPSHVTHAPRPRLSWAGVRAGAEDDCVGIQPFGGGDDFLLRATLRDEVRDLDPRQSRRELLVPDGQKRSRCFVVRVCESMLDHGLLRQRPEPPSNRRMVGREFPRPGLLDVEKQTIRSIVVKDYFLGKGSLPGGFAQIEWPSTGRRPRGNQRRECSGLAWTILRASAA
jgi:hypothetical protein